MSYRITGDCISCGNCSVICTRQAIDDGYRSRSLSSSLWQGYRITGACNGCGECVDMCPVGAIVKD